MKHKTYDRMINSGKCQVNIQLIISFILLYVCLFYSASICCNAQNQTDNSSTIKNPFVLSEKVKDEGGLRWLDLQVSIETRRPNKWWFPKRKSNFSIHQKNYLLHSCSGYIPNGHVCAIIGPSGAGKTTLLAALSGTTMKTRSKQLSGHVWLDARTTQKDGKTKKSDDAYDDDDEMSWEKSYFSFRQDGQPAALLQQNDLFFSKLTPKETLSLATFLQLTSLGIDDRKTRVQNIMTELGLSRVEHRLIGESASSSWSRDNGLSGGERRRLSVALETVTSPKVFFADEPTTGLDSAQAQNVVRIIADIAKKQNIPCLCSLHQPRASIWKMLDSFILMGPGGHIIYMGSRMEAVDYFASLGYPCPTETNPAEFFVDLVTISSEDFEQTELDRKRIHSLATIFRKRCTEKRHIENENGRMWNPPNISGKNDFSLKLETKKKKWNFMSLKRLGSLLKRSWKQNFRDVRINFLRLMASIGSAVLFAEIFPRVRDEKSNAASVADRTSMLTIGIISMSMMALSKTLMLFGKEKAIVMRERSRGQYTGLEYLLSKALTELPLDSLYASLFASSLKYMSKLNCSYKSINGIFSLMTALGASLGFAVGSITGGVEEAMSVGMPLMVVFMAVGLINPRDRKSVV